MASGQQQNASAFNGDALSPSLDGLPAFFTNGNVDDKKYESLLEDLRAHDLLGPAEPSTGEDAFASRASSLFFNNAFSAVFMGNFSDSTGFLDSSTGASATKQQTATSKPPPGFARAPPGLAPTETDLKWARGQQAFSRMEGSFHHTTGSSDAGGAGKADVDDAADVLDANEIPSLKALGLDDDDAASPVKRAPPGVPAPSAIPPPPGAWQQQPPPPPPPSQQQQQYQQQQQQYHQQHHQQHMPPQGPPPHGMQHPYAHQHHQQGPHGGGPPPPPPPPQSPHMHMHMPPPYGMRGPPPNMPPPPHMQQQMRGGPHPHPPPPPPPRGPGGMPYPPPMQMQMPPMHMQHMQQMQQMQMPPPNFVPPQPPRFKMMTPRDIGFVVQQQTKQIRSSDPFSDDYYFHNYVQKRSRGPAPRPGGRGLPLPSWKLEHIKSVDSFDASRAAKSREWETENHVLGRNSTRSLYRPKQLLNFAGDARETENRETEDAASASAESTEEPPKSAAPKMVVKTQKEVFASDLWVKRQQIDRGLQCLLSLQDARHLLDARGINVQQFHSMDAESIDPALAELRTRTTTLLLELAGLLGVAVPPTSKATPDQNAAPSAAAVGVTCDVEQLHRIVSVAKGKRLVSRALPLLHPSARFVLLPQLIEYLLSATGMSKISSDTATDDEDERLCQTIVLTLLYHPPAPSAELLTQCLVRAMHGHDLQTLRVLLYNRGRAEALQALLQRGGASINDATTSDETKQQWARTQESFVALATAIKQTA